MLKEQTYHDVIVAGGGLAGLSFAIQLARSGRSVLVVEKESYPLHRVCGEYISLESREFMATLGLDYAKINAPLISKLQVSSQHGRMVSTRLPLGGIGWSRFHLDMALAEIARNNSVEIKENTKVNDIEFNGNEFMVHTDSMVHRARVVFGSFGKRSNLDVKWQRPFATAQRSKLNNFIGIKYHVTLQHADDTISLHIFKNGYCGLVKVEGEKYNLCYLTNAANLQACNGDIAEMERTILCKNPFLREIFENSKMVDGSQCTISQVSFDRKSQVENHLLMGGDAAGMITPLCGNGMSIAFHSGKLASIQAILFLGDKISRQEMETNYQREWRLRFAARLNTGRTVQRLVSNGAMSELFIGTSKLMPGILRSLIRKTHGKTF